MKKFGLVLAMLAVVLVVGLTFLSCGGGGDVHDIEHLFDQVKNVANSGSLQAMDSGNNRMSWCRDHSAWHPYVSGTGMNHDAPAPFTLAEAVNLNGGSIYTTDSVSAANARETIKKLDSFYASKYKRDVEPYNAAGTSFPDGTSIHTWFVFYLRRSGEGQYGASAVPTTAPLLVYYYQFD